MQDSKGKELTVKPYSFKELCVLYDISGKTLLKWLKPFKNEIGERVGRYYNVLQVQTIFKRLGVPY